MNSSVEKVFPRGGKNLAVSSKPIKATSFSLFNKKGIKVKKKVKDVTGKRRKKTQKEETVLSRNDNDLIVKYVDDLTPSTLHEGALVLGIVCQITDKNITISLPGGLRGIVSISNVSHFYKELIVNSHNNEDVPGLNELFKVGDILPTRVISVSEEDNKRFHLSLDPKLINSKINEMETGLILVGSVKSEEDHGYVIDFGIPSVNGFLNFDKIENNQKLPIGKLVMCAVIRCVSAQYMSSVELSLLQKDLKNSHLPATSTYPIHSFIPGLQFSLTVTRVLKNGVEVSYRNEKSFKGLIYEDHLAPIFPKLDKIEVGRNYIGTLLYVKPLVNIPYFKVLSYKPENWIYQYGQIVKGKVIKSSRSGVTFRIGTKLIPTKCFIPLSKLSDSNKLTEHDVEIDTLYPVKKVVDKIRLKEIDRMRRCYIGTTEKAALEEKYYAVSDLKCGDIVPCKITSIGKALVHVKIGNIAGVVPFIDLTDIPISNPAAKFKVDQKVTARVTEINLKTRFVRLTLKPTLLDKKLNTIMNYNDVKTDKCYTGTVIKVSKLSFVVGFFNGVCGTVEKKFTPYSDEPTILNHYTVGQLVNCYVLGIHGNKLKLSLSSPKRNYDNLKIGEKYEVVVTTVDNSGLTIRVKIDKNEFITGMIPSELLSGYPGLGEALLHTFSVNQKLTACCTLLNEGSLPVFAISDIIFRFYEILGKENIDLDMLLNTGQVYPFLYRNTKFNRQQLTLSPLIPWSKYKFFVDMKDISDENCLDIKELSLNKFQIVFGTIIHISGVNVNVSLRLSDVWDKNYHTSLELLDIYLDGMKRIVNHHRETKKKHIKNITIGSYVSSVIPKPKENTIIHEVHLDNVVFGDKNGDVKGEVISGVVVWIDVKERLFVNTDISKTRIGQVSDEQFELENTSYRADIVYVGDEVVVAMLKGKGNGTFVFIPRKRHLNDFKNPGCPYSVGDQTRVSVERGKFNNLTAIDRQVLLLEEKKIWISYEETLRNSIKPLKRKLPNENHNSKIRRLENGSDSDMEVIDVKLSDKMKIKKERDAESDDDVQCEYVNVRSPITRDEIKQEIDCDEDLNQSMTSEVLDTTADMDIKSENESNDNNDHDEDIYRKERILLSSSSESESDDDDNVTEKENCLNVGFDWDVLKNRELLSGASLKGEEMSSSSDDEEETKITKKKRTKLSKAEKEEKAKAEEERLRLIEERLSRANVEPETADDFDRVLLGKPNSSALWVKYMAFHLQATEIEKARAVARRALKTIAFTEEREKLNVWVALLNLENLYGNEESLNKTLGEALMCNEPYHIHLHMLNMHGQSSKFQEMERVGNMLMKKFKDVENMWEDVGLGYYKVGKLESARHVLQRALPILERKKHVGLISKFAQMENKYGSSERAQTLYETILSSFPKRVDVWSCYVDMLVKSNSIDLARQVLERATSQNLPPKKMKTLFKKFIAFEEKYGTEENVEKVRHSAVEYVDSIARIADE